MPGFILVPRMVIINHPTLNQQLMMFFMQEPLWESQMSTQTTALSDLGDTLIMQGFETNMASVKIEEGGLDLFYFSFYFLFYFSIFGTTRVRVDRSCYHINHLIV